METRLALAQQVIRILNGGRTTKDSRWKEQEIELALNEIRNALAEIYFFQALKNGGNSLDSAWFTTFENVPVQLDTNRNMWYSDLPSLPIALPDKKGINMVTLMKDFYTQIIPMSNTSLWMFGESGTMDLQNNMGYFQDEQRIYYVNYIQNNYNLVLIDMVVNSMDIASDKLFPAPANVYEIMVDKCVQKYQPRIPVDVSNNNAPVQ